MVNINVVWCDDDADITVVNDALDYAEGLPVEVHAEDTDIIMLVHHHTAQRHNLIMFVKSKASYSVGDINMALSDQQNSYLLVCIAFTGCDMVSSTFGSSKEKLFERLCKGNVDKQIDVFMSRSLHKKISNLLAF